MRISFCAPSPSRTTCSARSSSTASSAAANGGQVADAALPACPVANSSTVSLVEVSLSTVVRLKLRFHPRASIACSAAAGTAASVNTKHSMVAMSGAIMPLPLAMPVIRTGVAADLDGAGGRLRKGVRGHDAARRRLPRRPRQRGLQRRAGRR